MEFDKTANSNNILMIVTLEYKDNHCRILEEFYLQNNQAHTKGLCDNLVIE